jgi:hypothetical protein
MADHHRMHDVVADQVMVAETAGAFGIGRIDALGTEDVRRAVHRLHAFQGVLQAGR